MEKVAKDKKSKEPIAESSDSDEKTPEQKRLDYQKELEEDAKKFAKKKPQTDE